MLPLFAVLSLVLCFEFQKLLFLSTKRKYSLVSFLNNNSVGFNGSPVVRD